MTGCSSAGLAARWQPPAVGALVERAARAGGAGRAPEPFGTEQAAGEAAGEAARGGAAGEAARGGAAGEEEDDWRDLPWLNSNPVGVPTERELYVERGRRPKYRLLLVRRGPGAVSVPVRR
ncbi:hypothetical protein HYH02_015306 [Chlamydomonas schloesseri]|uniref:Uncharacterized protein n=1 Tax=Chlamydomonas schloesseri TaxID=2026947 RepID=A0A835SPF5_9CHLO|nr:hypothetical protein HYH02_015306 [Chlamydomonas schloesseri]|eukprot:KAG2423606.1 hypothetical protein HYH02_015306 [Chlamydomonas schloesseri]